MSRPRRKVFGPLFYSALLAWVLVAIYGVVEVARPRVETWLKHRAIARMMRSPDVRTRLTAVLGLERESPAVARPYLLEALGDPNIDVRVAACRSLAHQGYESQTLISILSAAVDDENTETRIETTRIVSRIIALAGSKIRSSADATDGRRCSRRGAPARPSCTACSGTRFPRFEPPPPLRSAKLDSTLPWPRN